MLSQTLSFYIYFYLLILLEEVSANDDQDFSSRCIFPLNRTSNVDVYYINLDKSLSRRRYIEKHFQNHHYNFHRIRGLSIEDDIHIPEDVARNFYGKPLINTQEYPPAKADIKPNSMLFNKTVVISGLWGRKKHNRLHEIGCVASHLLAIYDAVHNAAAKSKYALITEDDIFIPYEINFEMMVASVPTTFGPWGTLQLFNSNEESMQNLWGRYMRNPDIDIFIPRWPKAAASFWSTCAYLIDRDIWRPIINQIVKPNFQNSNWIDIKLIAATRGDFCDSGIPSECCHDVKNNEKLSSVLCAFSPKGFQADAFLYALTMTYVLAAPLITNGEHKSSNSTLHQDHVAMFHLKAFHRQRQYMNKMLRTETKTPVFAKPICPGLIPLPY